MNYREMVMADLRLLVLRILSGAPGYQCNSSVLQMALQDYGHAVSRDLLHTEIAWLAEQGLLTQREIINIHVVTLSVRGLDVAQGHATLPGVRKPEPGC